MKKFLIIWTVITIFVGFLAVAGQTTRNKEERAKKAKIYSIQTKRTIIPEMMNYSEENAAQFGGFIIFIALFWGIPVGLGSLITLALRKIEL